MNANIGMQHPVAALIESHTPGSAITYGPATVVSEARGANLTWERADGSFRGDDIELDNDNGILGYSLEFETSGLKDAIRAMLLGEDKDQSDVYHVTDAAAPDVGFGYVRTMRETNDDGQVVTTFHGWWFHKLKFALNSEETRTKERNIEWRVPTLTGNGMGVSIDSTKKIKFAEHKTFSTYEDAEAFVEGHGTSETTPETTPGTT